MPSDFSTALRYRTIRYRTVSGTAPHVAVRAISKLPPRKRPAFSTERKGRQRSRKCRGEGRMAGGTLRPRIGGRGRERALYTNDRSDVTRAETRALRKSQGFKQRAARAHQNATMQLKKKTANEPKWKPFPARSIKNRDSYEVTSAMRPVAQRLSTP